MTHVIKFGTDGWRGIISDDFTFANLHRVALATARHFKKHKKAKNGITIGYDARFLSKEYAQEVAIVFAHEGITALLADAISPTPAVSYMTKKLNAAAGIVITASHNPAKYNGYKIKGDFGGPAFPEMIDKVEGELKKTIKTTFQQKKSFEELVAKKKIKLVDLNTPYMDQIRSLIDLDSIARSGLKIGYDAMFGAGQGIFEQLVPVYTAIRSEINPSFAGCNPEPLAKNLGAFMIAVPANNCHIGIATDGDADRLGAVDEKGTFVDSHRLFALTLKYLVEEKKYTGEVAKSFTIGELVNKMCDAYGIKWHLTQVGFKYLCNLMITRDIMVAGEESGGIAVKGHIPERDGIYVGLLMCEMLAKRGMTMSQAVEEIMKKHGWHHYDRVDHHLRSEAEKKKILKAFEKKPKKIGPFAVTKIETVDGTKFFFDNSWLLVRASGTEPLIRMYAESDTPDKVKQILKAAQSL